MPSFGAEIAVSFAVQGQPGAAMDEGLLRGGSRTCATYADRDAIPVDRRKVGMRVKVLEADGNGVAGRPFDLAGDLIHWSPLAFDLLAPLLEDWDELVLGADRRPVSGTKLDGSRWEARAGVLVQITSASVDESGKPRFDTLRVDNLEAPGLALIYPQLEEWDDLVLDSAMRVVSGTKLDGSRWVTMKGAIVRDPGIRTLEAPQLEEWDEVTLDGSLRIIAGTKLDGTRWAAVAGALVQQGDSSVSVSYTFDYDAVTGTSLPSSTAIVGGSVDLLLGLLGQSWAAGANLDGQPTVTTAAQHPGYALMPSPGPQPAGAAIPSYADFVSDGTHETALSGALDVIMNRLNARIGRKPRIIGACAAKGGQAIAAGDSTAGSDVGVGSDTFEEFLRIVASCAAISKATGRRLVVPAVIWLQGEEDFNAGTSQALYQRGLIRIRQVLDAKVREITGQNDPVLLYTYQTNRGGAAAGVPCKPSLAQLAASKTDPYVRCFGPVYWVDPNPVDLSHTTPSCYRAIGCQAGNMIVEDLFGPYWEPLRVVESWLSADKTKLYLRFHVPNVPNDPDTPDTLAIEADDTLVTVSTLGAGKGIDVLDDGGVAISSIAIKSGTTDTIEVAMSQALAGRVRWWIASRRTGSTGGCGKVVGARSGIRASTAFHTDALTGKTLYHWACADTGTLQA